MKKIFLLLIFLLFSCTSTKFVSSWCEPNKEIKISNLNKVLVVALFKNETSQHNAEDQMVGYLNGKGIQSYNYFKSNFNKNNEEAIRIKIKKDGFDGAVTMRLIDVDKEKIYTPGESNFYPEYYRDFSGYYFNRWNYSTKKGYYTTTKTFTVETNVYSIKMDKIIWTALTETTNPEGLEKLTNEVAKVVYKQMLKDGFVN
ncbi:hypothetical protein [Flavobacterium psychrophilum]|uniref:hypothetical protein n=1 Tax=Flavobacterium psychrophilum TaxID=96345 RepID=UPI00090B740F|nr:hypothetical protein [Flavobacterium psychrophilum]EKT2072613.1 hypothetical protein [Flavobacterium psychrophilum]EKT4492126.1 hypothetical protein [Flavobacterium psychrophilum]SHH93133.1 Probable lipoprotein precursor [Flavobacterium psychrophilum]